MQNTFSSGAVSLDSFASVQAAKAFGLLNSDGPFSFRAEDHGTARNFTHAPNEAGHWTITEVMPCDVCNAPGVSFDPHPGVPEFPLWLCASCLAGFAEEHAYRNPEPEVEGDGRPVCDADLGWGVRV